jgi:carbamoyl-phosphate synthase small subunit
MKNCFLVLEDGSSFRGYSIGSNTQAVGEVVFSTSMTGYQEMLTDPSFAGQIVVPTYPLIGNYGINTVDSESSKIQVTGFAVKQDCDFPSHSHETVTVNDFLKSQHVPGITGIDTRAITRRLRSKGVMMGAIAPSIESGIKLIESTTGYGEIDLVKRVTSPSPGRWDSDLQDSPLRILVSDYGVKYNILRLLAERNCDVTFFPADTPAQDLIDLKPDGILLSPGPGDPEMLDYAVSNAKFLVGNVPVFGICLGNQILARCFGAKTYKLKFGHRGANHPVKDLRSGRVYITAQNHGYSVDGDSLPSDIAVTHQSLNDSTVEGLRHKSLPVMAIQYHSEASPGPKDNEYIFDEFISMIRAYK